LALALGDFNKSPTTGQLVSGAEAAHGAAAEEGFVAPFDRLLHLGGTMNGALLSDYPSSA
jgi:hypothetical protein